MFLNEKAPTGHFTVSSGKGQEVKFNEKYNLDHRKNYLILISESHNIFKLKIHGYKANSNLPELKSNTKLKAHAFFDRDFPAFPSSP